MDDGQCPFVDLIDNNVVLRMNIGLYLGMGIGDIEMDKKGGDYECRYAGRTPHHRSTSTNRERRWNTAPPEISRMQCFRPLKEFPLNDREPSPRSLSLPTAEGWFTLRLSLAI